MKIEAWLLQYEDATTIYDYLSGLLPGRLDRNALDALKSVVKKFCTRRTRYSRGVRISWLLVNQQSRKDIFRRALFDKKEYDFTDPPEYPNCIEISWSRGFSRDHIIRSINLRIKPLSKPGG